MEMIDISQWMELASQHSGFNVLGSTRAGTSRFFEASFKTRDKAYAFFDVAAAQMDIETSHLRLCEMGATDLNWKGSGFRSPDAAVQYLVALDSPVGSWP